MGTFENIADVDIPKTGWREVCEELREEAPKADMALESLLEIYQLPLRTHLMSRFGMSPEDAADCLHGFIANKILEKGLLAKVDEKRGRLRTYLLTALDRFVISEHRRQASLKRAPGAQAIPLHELTEQEEARCLEMPSVDFDLAWARAVLAKALEGMKAECGDNGRAKIWGVFEGRLLRPLLDGSSPRPYEELVTVFEIESPAQASNVLVTGKRMFARHLRAVIRGYAVDEENAEAEIKELRAILAQA